MHIFMDGALSLFFQFIRISTGKYEVVIARIRQSSESALFLFFFSSFSFLNVSKKKMCSRKEEDGKK